jgi:hypothetical protein
MKRDTRRVLVVGGIAAGVATALGLILFWPKTASAKTGQPGLPVELDVNLTAAEKQDVASLIYNQKDPAALAQAAYKYQQEGAPIAATYIAEQAMSLLKPQLDDTITVNDFDILLPLYIWNDPVQIQSAGLVLQSKGLPKAADLVMKRAVYLSKQ